MNDIPAPADPKGGMGTFRRANPRKAKLPRQEAKRQGDIARLAFMVLGGKDGAIAFLNTSDPTLNARPLDVAMASDEGYREVEKMIQQKATLHG